MKTQALLITALTALAGAQSLCDQYGYAANGGYYANNNEWGMSSGSGSQCTYIDRMDGGGVSFHTEWSWANNPNNVKAYPYAGREISNKRHVSDIGSMTTSASWQYSGNNIRANVAYDLFTASDPNHDTSSGDYELMIWLGRLGDVYPIGNSIGNVNIEGRNWNLYYGYNGNMQVYSFVAAQQTNSWSGNVKNFYNYLSSNRGFPASSQYLITFQFGSEPFTGQNARFTVNNWSANIN